jgi:hypothetical protein
VSRGFQIVDRRVGRPAVAFSTVGSTLYDFRAADSSPVAWVESPTGDAYFSTAEDIGRYAMLFETLRGGALSRVDSVHYLRSLAADVERYLGEPSPGRQRRLSDPHRRQSLSMRARIAVHSRMNE